MQISEGKVYLLGLCAIFAVSTYRQLTRIPIQNGALINKGYFVVTKDTSATKLDTLIVIPLNTTPSFKDNVSQLISDGQLQRKEMISP
ncbi:MAG: hypothetical protein JSR97_10150 [Verrucomicrobia bacterium]|nr:hypothetical protein [Verrucomicrobiota bacterium]